MRPFELAGRASLRVECPPSIVHRPLSRGRGPRPEGRRVSDRVRFLTLAAATVPADVTTETSAEVRE